MLWLASTSPRRSALLAAAGFRFERIPPGPEIDGHGAPIDVAGQRAASKARGAAPAAPPPREGAVILGVDTVVDLDGVELGKPTDAAAAERMIVALAGREHRVHSAVHAIAVDSDGGRREAYGVASATVRFDALDAEQIASYVAGGSWQGKEGGYGIQDVAGAFARVVPGTGDVDTVIGLSIASVEALLEALRPASGGA